jgi:hypothetical protein
MPYLIFGNFLLFLFNEIEFTFKPNVFSAATFGLVTAHMITGADDGGVNVTQKPNGFCVDLFTPVSIVSTADLVFHGEHLETYNWDL